MMGDGYMVGGLGGRGPSHGSGAPGPGPNSRTVPLLDGITSRGSDKEQRMESARELKLRLENSSDSRDFAKDPFSIVYQLSDMFYGKVSSDVKKSVAVCLGLYGGIMGPKLKDFLAFLFESYEAAGTDDIRSYYLMALLALVKKDVEARKRIDEKSVTKIMAETQRALENAESGTVLIPLLDIASLIASAQPSVFEPHFRDVVDILAGWYIEKDQTASVLERCEYVMKKLKHFWLKNLDFCIDMLSQFFEDAEAYVEDSKNSSQKHSAQEFIMKSSALISASRTIVQSFSDQFKVVSEGEPFQRFVRTSIERVESCVEGVIQRPHNGIDALLASSIEWLGVIVEIPINESKIAVQKAMKLVEKICRTQGVDRNTLATVISTINQVATKSEPEMFATFVDSMIGPSGYLPALRFHSSPKVSQAVFNAYRSLLVPKGISSLSEAYKNVVGELETCLKLLEGSGSFTLGIAESPDFSETVVTVPQAEWIAMFNSAVLGELGIAKNSLIGMWSLSPNLFELFTSKGLHSEKWLIQGSPLVHYSLLKTLYAHCATHDHFITSSDLMVDNLSNPIRLTQQSSGYLSILLNVLSDLFPLSATILATETQDLCFDWVKDLLKALHDPVFLPANPLLEAAVTAMGSLSSMTTHAGRCLSAILALPTLQHTSSFWQKLIRSIITLCKKTGDESLISYLRAAPFAEILKFRNASPSLPMPKQIETGGGTIGPFHFKAVVDFLLRRELPQLIDEDSSFLAMDSIKILLLESRPSRVTISKAQGPLALWDWAIWEAAKVCVSSKLKTTLGKPAETFLKIENEIKSLASETLKESGGNIHSGSFNWTRVRLLLTFLEHLDKQMYNAYEGSASALLAPEAAVKTFFRTNRRTCEEWIGRIRIAVMTVALNNSHYAMVLRCGQQACFDLEFRNAPRNRQYIELLISLMADALISSGKVQILQGLHSWVKKVLGLRFPWLKASVDMAGERYEAAVKGYTQVLEGENPEGPMTNGTAPENGLILATKLSTTEERFVRKQIVECFLHLKDWKSGEKWLKDCEREDINSVPATRNQLYYIQRLGSFQLIPGTEPEAFTTEDPGFVNWNKTEFTRRIEGYLALHNPSEKVSLKMEESVLKYELAMVLRQQWSDADSLDEDMDLLGRLIAMLKLESKKNWNSAFNFEGKDLESVVNSGHKASLSMSATLSYWMKLIDKEKSKSDLPSVFQRNFSFDLAVSKSARKTKNPEFSARILMSHIKDIGGMESEKDSGTSSPLQLSKMLKTPQIQGLAPSQRLRVYRHVAKLVHGESHEEEAFGLVVDSVSRVFESGMGMIVNSGIHDELVDIVCGKLGQINIHADYEELKCELARAILSLSDWLQAKPALGSLLLQDENSVFIKLVEERLNIAENHFGALDSGTVVLAMLHLAARVCPELAKAQRALADWAYKAGMKAFESKGEIVLLTEAEIQMIHSCLPLDSSPAAKSELVSLVSSLRSDESGLSESVDFIGALQQKFPGGVNEEVLLNIWEHANRRLFLFYDFAARSYFNYLRLSDDSVTTVTATLRLLRLLVKHVHYLDNNLMVEFENADPKRWHSVMPQLFARLNHPSKGVRDTLCNLLSRMAVESPSLVVYPAVIGARQSSEDLGSESKNTKSDAMVPATEGIDLHQPSSPQVSLMQQCCSQLVEVLSEVITQLVDDVRQFSAELDRITLLREEKWLSVLTFLNHEMNRRLKQLDEDCDRTRKNSDISEETQLEIIADKTFAFTKVIFQAIEDLYSTTTEKAETPNEQSFVTQFRTSIGDCIERYKNCGGKVKEAWLRFNELLKFFEDRASKRHNLNLDLNQLSPILARMTNTLVPLPGREEHDQLTIAKVATRLVVLPTKTRPKKLYFVGSDGKHYAYLFKGLEDLHLDERIMQFLRICNLMMTSKKSSEARYVARNYSVTPLGPRSGLIQWVEGATPIFSLYRRWQIRQAAAATPGSTAATVTRPSEMFYGQLAPILEQQHGIKDLNNRHKWPQSAVKAAITALMEQTPKDLLAKELWCRSGNPDVWWRLTQSFARSTAVMSVIGYIIGLGDRHLDNVLVDMSSGEVVHIDYNICFEKGRHLRVPETVPFRMTPNLQTALGPTGVEGNFRLSCEDVLRVLRGGRETLLILLEAFVYDPLVDWTHEGERTLGSTLDTGFSNFVTSGIALSIYGTQNPRHLRKTALQASWKLFNTRRLEMTQQWKSNKLELGSTLTTLVERLVLIRPTLVKLGSVRSELQAMEIGTAENEEMPSDKEEKSLKESLIESMATVHAACHDVKNTLSAHHKMMEIRNAMKTLARLKPDGNEFETYLCLQKEFIEKLAVCLRVIGDSKELSVTETDYLITGLTHLIQTSELVCDRLMSLGSEGDPTLDVHLAPKLTEPAEGSQKEKRNVQGMSIWKKVKVKLEGRDPDEGKKTNVQDQIDFIVRNSTSLDNLALMYEGWTSWV